MKWIGLLLIAALGVACGDDVKSKGAGPISINNSSNNVSTDAGNVSTGDGGSSTDGGGGVPDATMSSEDAPQIIEFTANPTTLNESGSSSLSLIVTDPQGSDDIAAVRLIEQSSGTSLGNFAQDGGGAYSTSVSWNDISSAVDITFDGSFSVVLTAEAIDNAGERSTRSISLALACSEADSACGGTCGETFCGGECLSAQDLFGSNQNCGGCGNSCGGGDICSIDECLDPNVAAAPCTSDAQCGGQAMSCQTEAATGIPGGLCLIICSQDGCGPNSECVGITDGNGQQIPVCFPTCTTADDCREGWECQELDGTATMACFPVQ